MTQIDKCYKCNKMQKVTRYTRFKQSLAMQFSFVLSVTLLYFSSSSDQPSPTLQTPRH